MGDLISRQAAINAIEHRLAEPAYQHTGEDWYVGMNCAESELYDLPPAQSSEIQDILEYLDTVLHPIISPDHWNVYSELHDMVSMLPSAQPEIIHCRDCEHQIENFMRINAEKTVAIMFIDANWMMVTHMFALTMIFVVWQKGGKNDNSGNN